MKPQVQVTHPEGWWTVSVPMHERDRVRAEAATGDVPYALGRAATLFDLIYDGLAGGWLKEGAIIALAEMAADSFKALAEKEGVALEHLHQALKLAAGQLPKGEGEAA